MGLPQKFWIFLTPFHPWSHTQIRWFCSFCLLFWDPLPPRVRTSYMEAALGTYVLSRLNSESRSALNAPDGANEPDMEFFLLLVIFAICPWQFPSDGNVLETNSVTIELSQLIMYVLNKSPPWDDHEASLKDMIRTRRALRSYSWLTVMRSNCGCR